MRRVADKVMRVVLVISILAGVAYYAAAWIKERQRALAEANEAPPMLTLRLLDPQGLPLAGVRVATQVTRTAEGEVLHPIGKLHQGVVSDASGIAELPAQEVLPYSRGRGRGRVLYAAHEDRRLAAIFTVGEHDVGQLVDVSLSPACRTRVRLTSSKLAAAGRALRSSFLYIRWEATPHSPLVIASTSADVLLPPEQYVVSGYGEPYVIEVEEPLQIEPGTAERSLQIDLPVEPVVAMLDKPAPELRGVSEWAFGEPTTLESLRGKVVLLHLWTSSSPYAARGLRWLALLQKDYARHGLVTLAVHEGGAAPDDFRRMLGGLQYRIGDEDEPPVRLALDGPGVFRIPGRDHEVSGQTAAAYGGRQTLVIGRDGRLLARVRLRNGEETRTAIEEALGIEKLPRRELPPMPMRHPDLF